MRNGSWWTEARRIAVAALAIAGAAGAAVGAPASKQQALSAEQIVARNAAARGGADAWRRIQTMVWIGHIESARLPVSGMRFVLDQKRPNKTRFEIDAMSQKTLRVFDGRQGWELRPARNGRRELQPFTSEELKFAQAGQGIDGPLIDHAAKGNVVSLEGLDEIEGHKAYRLEVRLLSGERDRLWVDAKTFLDVRYDRVTEGPVRLVAGRVVSVHYRDYKAFDGLEIPSIIEMDRGAGGTHDRMVIERVVLNSPLDDSTFTKPAAARWRNSRRLQARQLRMPEGSESPAQ
jgi:outer membrane lipoprotein-sorting protein